MQEGKKDTLIFPSVRFTSLENANSARRVPNKLHHKLTWGIFTCDLNLNCAGDVENVTDGKYEPPVRSCQGIRCSPTHYLGLILKFIRLMESYIQRHKLLSHSVTSTCSMFSCAELAIKIHVKCTPFN